MARGSNLVTSVLVFIAFHLDIDSIQTKPYHLIFYCLSVKLPEWFYVEYKVGHSTTIFHDGPFGDGTVK